MKGVRFLRVLLGLGGCCWQSARYRHASTDFYIQIHDLSGQFIYYLFASVAVLIIALDLPFDISSTIFGESTIYLICTGTGLFYMVAEAPCI